MLIKLICIDVYNLQVIVVLLPEIGCCEGGTSMIIFWSALNLDFMLSLWIGIKLGTLIFLELIKLVFWRYRASAFFDLSICLCSRSTLTDFAIVRLRPFYFWLLIMCLLGLCFFVITIWQHIWSWFAEIIPQQIKLTDFCVQTLSLKLLEMLDLLLDLHLNVFQICICKAHRLLCFVVLLDSLELIYVFLPQNLLLVILLIILLHLYS